MYDMCSQVIMAGDQSGLLKSVSGIKYHGALVGAMGKGIYGMTIILCSFTINTSSPTLQLPVTCQFRDVVYL